MSSKFTVTAKFIEFINVFKGQDIDTDLVNEINQGLLDKIEGKVVKVGYSEENNSSIFNRVELETKTDGNYILTTNSAVSLVDLSTSPNTAENKTTIDLFDILKNTYLINRPREIFIKKFSDREIKILEDAAKYGQKVACVYCRKNGFIKYLDVINEIDDQHQHYFSNDSRPPKY